MLLSMGLEPGDARWQAQTEPLSYGGHILNFFEC